MVINSTVNKFNSINTFNSLKYHIYIYIYIMFVLEPFLQLLFNFFFQLSIWYRKAGTSKGACVIVPLLSRIQVPFGENEGHVRMFLHYKMNYLAMWI